MVPVVRDQFSPQTPPRFSPLILEHNGSALPWLVDDRAASTLAESSSYSPDGTCHGTFARAAIPYEAVCRGIVPFLTKNQNASTLLNRTNSLLRAVKVVRTSQIAVIMFWLYGCLLYGRMGQLLKMFSCPQFFLASLLTIILYCNEESKLYFVLV